MQNIALVIEKSESISIQTVRFKMSSFSKPFIFARDTFLFATRDRLSQEMMSVGHTLDPFCMSILNDVGNVYSKYINSPVPVFSLSNFKSYMISPKISTLTTDHSAFPSESK